MIPENPDRRETQHTVHDPLRALAELFRIETVEISAFAQISIAVPGDELRRPPYPAAACPEAGRVGMGSAPDARQSQLAALCEAVELASCCVWGDEPILHLRATDLGPLAVPTGSILGFSASQIAARDAWNLRYGRHDWRPQQGVDPIDWIAAREAMTGKAHFIAADAVLIGRRDPGDPTAVAIADSNGCAAGPTEPAAQVAALLELIERDATGRWWHGRRCRPTLPLSVLPPDLAEWLLARDRRTSLLDITTDIGIPVVAALSHDPSGRTPALGFAARMTQAEAAFAAVREMLGVETALPPWRDALNDPLMAEWLAQGPDAMPPLGGAALPAAATPPGDPLETCLAALDRLGLQAFIIDLTRKVFGVPVARAFVPGLCHYKPRHGHPRLLAQDARDMPPIRRVGPNPLPLLI